MTLTLYIAVMAGRPSGASRPSTLQRPVGGWPGRPKRAPGHDGAWRIEVNVGWYIPSGDYIGTLVNVMAGRLLVASRPSALQRPVGGWPGRPKQAPGHDGTWRIEVNVGWYIPSGDYIGTLVNVMAGRLLVASRPSALQRPVGGWPGRPKRAAGHDGAWRVEVNVGWYIPNGDYIGTLVNVMAGRLLVASRPSALQRPVGGWPGRPKRAPGHDGA